MNAALLAYALRRLLLLIPTFVVINFVGFSIIHMAPGDPVELFLSGGLASGQSGINTQRLADAEKAKAELRKELGLDRPIPVQFVSWLSGFATGDLGNSLKDRQPVWDKIRARLPVTVGIDLVSLFITYLFAIPLGVYSAVRPGTRLDQFFTVALFALYSLPGFWVAVLLIVFFCGGDYFAWFPPAGLHAVDYDPSQWGFWRSWKDLAYHLTLPLFVTTLGSYTELSRYLRSSMLENARQDFVRTARAKGVPEWSVIFSHMLRNSLIPMVTIVAGILPGLIGGAVILEMIFSIPGLGQLGYQAVLARDYPVILALFGTSVGLTLIGILIADLLLALVDPRITFTGTAA
ncbi:MAG TPA: ABC transporter permease [Myxococcota bacterium]|nr:ABC transporter permease [Myxococcota bacterium]